MAAAASIIDNTDIEKPLAKFLKKQVEKNESLAVADKHLGGLIKEKLGITCVHDKAIAELVRGVRSQISNLIAGLSETDMNAMALGLSHSLSRYKLKFTPDKVDTMIVQAIGLLDDLDKELNTYTMRMKEWYGWHFPELGRVLPDNLLYVKVVRKMGRRENAKTTDFSDILEPNMEEELKHTAEISMGTEVAEEDISNVLELCDQILGITEYREQLYDYLKNRMNAIAPNLTVLVGEIVGARLIAHAGSLMNLAKQPSSTIQILGAEKALFRALKTKHETPKYGLIYHASLVGQASLKNKGKISRVLAAKAALSTRVDALGDSADPTPNMGFASLQKLEIRRAELEGKVARPRSGSVKTQTTPRPYDKSRDSTGGVRASTNYNEAADFTPAAAEPKKRKVSGEEEAPKRAKIEVAEEAPSKKEKKDRDSKKKSKKEKRDSKKDKKSKKSKK